MKKKIFLLTILLCSIFLLNYSVKADEKATSATFTCSYYAQKANEDGLTVSFLIDFKATGDDYKILDCTRYESRDVANVRGNRVRRSKSCKDYNFDANSNYKSDLTCPSSIDVDEESKTIKWVASYKGKYVHEAGTRSNYEEDENYKATCLDYHNETTCLNATYYSCVWNEEYQFCNTDNLVYVRCSQANDIPIMVPKIISFVFNFLKIATPIVLVLVSMITLIKALAASKEDEIKKAQNSLVKKLVAAALIFFITSIVQFVILKVADYSEGQEFLNCLNCFLNNSCENTAYYKTTIGSFERVTTLKANCGDVNSDGEINILDLVALKSKGNISTIKYELKNADLDGNGAIDGNDVEILSNYLIGKISSLSCSQKK